MKENPDSDPKPELNVESSLLELGTIADNLSLHLAQSRIEGTPGTSSATGQSSSGGISHSNLVMSSNDEIGIKEVWNHNLHEEFYAIRDIVETYTYVAMDTEFPGIVLRPIGENTSTVDFQYRMVRVNVDLLRIIQLGLTFLDENGKTPPGYSTWQFNFKFSLTGDFYNQNSIEMLKNSGIQFQRHETEGIDPFDFAALLMTSGIVLMDNITWITFHSSYDFAYLLKMLTNTQLPEDENEFFDLLKTYFPLIYDVKYLMMSCKYLKGGLQDLANQLNIQRVGSRHQAGSDSLVTAKAFFKMRELYFEGIIDDTKYGGVVYGIGTSHGAEISSRSSSKEVFRSLPTEGSAISSTEELVSSSSEVFVSAGSSSSSRTFESLE